MQPLIQDAILATLHHIAVLLVFGLLLRLKAVPSVTRLELGSTWSRGLLRERCFRLASSG